MQLRFATTLAMTVLALPVRAQTVRHGAALRDTTTVLPGDGRLEAERVVPHRATWRVTVVDSAGGATVQGLWTDIWARTEDEGRPVVVFRQLYADTTGTILVDNETVFDATSFRTFRSTQQVPAGSGRGSYRVSYRYEGDSVSGRLQRPAGAEPRDFTVVFHRPVWEPLAPVALLFPLDRLAAGGALRYPIWNQVASGGQDDVTWYVVHVDSVGSAALPDGSTGKVWYLTQTTAALPNVVMRIRHIPAPPYGLWLRVERPGLTREWTLVDWQPFARVPAVAAGH
jgi:hypothetical protein